MDDFKAITSCVPADGATIYLWHDKWNQEPLDRKFQESYSFAKDKMITVKEARILINDGLEEMFFLPLSMIAFEQCNELIEMINNI